MTKKVLKHTNMQQYTVWIPELVLQLGNIGIQSYIELEEKFNPIKHKDKHHKREETCSH